MTDIVERIAIVVPTLNEERHIAACLDALLPQADALQADVMVLDGGSTDATIDIVTARMICYPNLQLIANPARLQSAAVNLAAELAAPEVTILVRADAHAGYPADFVSTCVRELRARDATSVVVPMRTLGEGHLQRAIAAVQNSRLGNGGSAHRAGGLSGFVDHGHHAAFDRSFFVKLGGYDTTFAHNEDAEHDERARRAGGRIWMCGDAVIDYYPRARLWPLARQYARHGAGRARTVLKHSLLPRPRQMAAPMILILCVVGVAVAPFSLWGLAIPAGYAALCAGWACAEAWRTGDPWMLAMAPAAMTVHLSWAVGFLRTLGAAVAAAVTARSPRHVLAK